MRWLAAIAIVSACTLRVDDPAPGFRCDDGQTCPAGQVCVAGVCEEPGGGDPDATPATDAPAPTIDAPAGADVPRAHDPYWWDPAWPHRRRVVVTNPGPGLLPQDVQVVLAVDADTTLAGPRDAIRLMHYETTSDWYQMPRVVDETAGTDEHIWIRLWDDVSTSEPLDHYWLYYGNPSPGGGLDDNPADVFDYVAPFSAFDPSLVILNAATVSGGELRLDYDEHVRTTATWGPGYAVDFCLRVPDHAPRYWGGFHRQNDFADDVPWLIWITRDAAAQIWPEFLAGGGGGAMPWTGTRVDLDPEPHIYGVERLTDRIVYRFDNAIRDMYELPAPFTEQVQARLTNEGAMPVFFDFLRIRRARYPHPTVTLGPEETY